MKKIIFVFGVIFFAIIAITIYTNAEKSKNIHTKDVFVSEPTNNLDSSSPISIEYLRSQKFEGSDIVIDRELSNGINYRQYIAHYQSQGFKIFGLLTVPTGNIPEGGFAAIVFNHGYVPPLQYKTTEKYLAYVDGLARNGFVVFKIDMRGHGESEGIASGSYFSSSYTIDAINALKSLQKLKNVNPTRIGVWGHSMSGNSSLRAMLVSDEFKAGVIWAGAVYSYKDFSEYGISDNSYQRNPLPTQAPAKDANRETSDEIQRFRDKTNQIDFDSTFWKSISLTKNLKYLNSPLQLNHAEDDDVVDVNYSLDLAEVLKNENKTYELNTYKGGGHNINSPYFEQAMANTIKFFKNNL